MGHNTLGVRTMMVFLLNENSHFISLRDTAAYFWGPFDTTGEICPSQVTPPPNMEQGSFLL
jgi:hypothetical protein